ncbi:M1 family metallopeptidase [Echinicola sp. 20G]|uniref:M1 family metallopeptidase n=1 Tax=Echinicola sp. 20G TaxID=2781961 RepID=UPI0019102F59|nr:M1 family metallopeptidase [Echinicola sp. 20G]
MNIKFSFALMIGALMFFACQSQKSTIQSPGFFQDSVKIEKPIIREVSIAEKKQQEIVAYRPSPERKFDLLHSSLDISFDFKRKLVFGEVELLLKPYFYNQNQLVLDAKDFDIQEVILLEEGDKKPLGIRYDSEKLLIYLPKEYSMEDTVQIGIKYTTHPSKNSGEGSEAITDNQGLYFINPDSSEMKPTQIWTQGETNHNSKWFPTIDVPNERATHDLKLTVPEAFTTVSNGELIDQLDNQDGTRTDHWEMSQAIAPYLVAFAVGDFVKIEDQAGDLSLGYYVESRYAEGAKKVFKRTPEMIAFYSELLGVSYPWKKYDQVVVRDFVSGAMENTTVSIFMEELNMNAREAIDSEYDGIIAHELFHHWFGDYVTTESWSNLPLNESFANYGEYLWYEYFEGRDAADLHHIGEMETYFYEAEEKQVDLIRFEYENNEDMFDSHSYAKGGRILHMLRDYLGDKAFFQGLNLYLKKYAFKSVEVHDLRLALEEVSGRDLNWFFDQWFLAAGHPKLEVEWDFSLPENILLSVKQIQDLTSTPLYRIPFEVSWYSGDKRFSKRFELNQVSQQFALENGSPVDLVLFDEFKKTLAELKTNRTKNEWLRQFELSKSGVSRYEALDSLALREMSEVEIDFLIQRGLDDAFWPIREVTMRSFSDYFTSEELLNELVDLAANDSSNSVRASAIEILSENKAPNMETNYLLWMEDSSYYVAGAALSAFLELEDARLDKKEVAYLFEEEGSIRTIVPLVDFYTSEMIPGKGRWLHQQFEKTSGQDLYYLIGYYGDYFTKLPEEGSGKAIDNLRKIASNHKDAYMRLAAFQTLFGFIDDEGVKEIVMRIYAEERDPEVKSAEDYFLAPYRDEN